MKPRSDEATKRRSDEAKAFAARRGVILPMMLLILVLLGLLAATTAFYVHADMSATWSTAHRQQARLAADAGLQAVMLFMRTARGDVDAWYHNPGAFHRVIVWSEEVTPDVLGTAVEFDDEGTNTYRFSVVADNPDDDEKLVRYGITDESSKLNINVASVEQLASLIGRFATEEMNVVELVDALLDWRDPDTEVRASGAEDEYYAKLDPPYKVKNGVFDTTEELLLVRGFTGELMYGEDFDRNGLMSPNENDGEDGLFPPDDADNKLKLGLYPYITVYSRDTNTTWDNKPRVHLVGDQAAVSQQLLDVTDDQAKLNFLASAGQGSGLASPADLLKDRPSQTGQDAIESPLADEDMGWVMDQTTLSPSPELVGLININAATAPVLATLPGLTEEDVVKIVEARAELTAEEKRSTGWLAAVIGGEKFAEVASLISARGTRYRVDVLGYADHVGTMARIETIVEMRGPVAQIVYQRDLTTLGTNFPIRYAEGDSELVGYDD